MTEKEKLLRLKRLVALGLESPSLLKGLAPFAAATAVEPCSQKDDNIDGRPTKLAKSNNVSQSSTQVANLTGKDETADSFLSHSTAKVEDQSPEISNISIKDCLGRLYDANVPISIIIPQAIPSPWVWMHAPSSTEEKDEPNLEALQSDWMELQTTLPRPKLKGLADLFVKNNCTYGKWMIFVPSIRIDQVWSALHEKMCQSKLGPCTTIKIATQRQGNRPTLFCVYVPDFTDQGGVEECLWGIRSICQDDKCIYFKADGMTYCDVYANNKWKLKVSFYSHQRDNKEIRKLF